MKKLLLASVLMTAALSAPAFAADPLAGWNDNKPQSLQSLKAPVRVVNLWATWCGPCRKEMPAMSAWYKSTEKKGSVDMVGIALDTTDNIGKFLKQTPVSYPIWRYTGANSRNFMKAHATTSAYCLSLSSKRRNAVTNKPSPAKSTKKA